MRQADEIILAHWQTSLENVSCSPLEFYEMVENALIESEFPEIFCSRIKRKEGGWFSPQRIYLRIRFQKLYFDVSAFVIGNTLVIGWWLHQDSSNIGDLLTEIPVIGFLLERILYRATYYRVDYFEHFQHLTHSSILFLVNELRKEKGLAALQNEAQTPIWEDVW